MNKKQYGIENHDELCERLKAQIETLGAYHQLRPIGVKDRLFRLSAYISKKKPVPDYETLLFLHAYIFALEGATASLQREVKELRKRQDFPPYFKRVKPRQKPLRRVST